MATLGIHKDLLLEFAKLEKPVQKRVHEVFDKFREHRHAGLHLEKLENPRDSRILTIRVSKFMRGVVLAPDSGDSFLLLKVMAHDDAIAWALSHRATVNSATQGIELRDDIALERAADDVQVCAEAARLLEPHTDRPFRHVVIDEARTSIRRSGACCGQRSPPGPTTCSSPETPTSASTQTRCPCGASV
ncbi:hypothetical protein ACFCW4_26115 [Streptomyces virginiae]|uniref:hypothetical protein n=1 Tax=Streptomyces virginiae TaxID=1961 RepID=UPI003249D934